MFTVSSQFIGSFKLGDNINHNLRILTLLYRYSTTGEKTERELLCKPIILTLVSITEAILHDFHFRIKHFTAEGVRNLSEEVIGYIRGKRQDKLEKYISSARKHDFFSLEYTNFYDVLDVLRKLRNRIHIQNPKNHFEPNEIKAFNKQRKIQAEEALEIVMKTMAKKYGRSGNLHCVEDFNLPWKEHYPSLFL